MRGNSQNPSLGAEFERQKYKDIQKAKRDSEEHRFR